MGEISPDGRVIDGSWSDNVGNAGLFSCELLDDVVYQTALTRDAQTCSIVQNLRQKITGRLKTENYNREDRRNSEQFALFISLISCL